MTLPSTDTPHPLTDAETVEMDLQEFAFDEDMIIDDASATVQIALDLCEPVGQVSTSLSLDALD